MRDSQDTKQNDTSFHWRGLTSFLVTLGFILLVVTGAVLYATPQGRVAQWTDWRFAGLSKEQWAAVHMISGILFLVASTFHLYYNWSVFLNYIKTRAGLNLKREMAIAVGTAALLVIGVLLGVPPFVYVVDINDRIKAYWEERSEPAPYPHAEDSTLEDFAQRTGVALAELQARLAELGFTASNASTTMLEASQRLGISPSKLFTLLNLTNTTNGSAKPAAPGSGRSGMGLKKLQDVCAAQGIDLRNAVLALQAAGISSSGDDTMRDIAERAQRSPSEILSLIKAGNRSDKQESPAR